MKSQCSLVSNLLNQPIRFLQIPMYPRNRQDELGPRRFLNMVEKPRIGVLTEINLLYRFISNGCLWLRGIAVSYTHLRAHETRGNLVCRLLL